MPGLLGPEGLDFVEQTASFRYKGQDRSELGRNGPKIKWKEAHQIISAGIFFFIPNSGNLKFEK